MADIFERMLKDLQREHTRRLAELNEQIALLKENINRGSERISVSSVPSIETKPTGATGLADQSRIMSTSFISEGTVRSSDQCKGNDKHKRVVSRRTQARRSLQQAMTLMPSTQSQSTRATVNVSRDIFEQGFAITESCHVAGLRPIAKRPRYFSAKGIVESHGFEAATAVIIFACTLCNAMEAQFDGMKRGYSLEIAGYGDRNDLWENGTAILNAADAAFSIVFILEFLGRLVVFRRSMFYSCWAWLDLLVVLSSVLDLILGGAYSSKGSKAIRMVRMVKVARLLKALKFGGHFFNVLHVLMASVRSSFSTLCWALLMIIPVQIVCALMMFHLLDSFYDRGDVSISKKKGVFLYFGTFSRSLITFFEVLFANYAPACRVLINSVGEEYATFIIAYRCICGFSVLCVVQAVFLQQSMKMVSLDSEVMVREKNFQEEKFSRNLEKLFRSLDITGDGHLTKAEFFAAIHHEEVRLFCHALGLDPHDLEDIYHMVDAGDGVTRDQFLQSAKHIRKQARTIDMARVLANVQKIRKLLELMPDVILERMGSRDISAEQSRAHATKNASTMTCPRLFIDMVSQMPDCIPSRQRLPLSL